MFKQIALLDMDSYFASIECVKNPRLNNYPIAVVGNGKNPVVTSVNYRAKAFGIKAGMGLKEAKNLCRNILFLKADFSYYEFTTLKIVSIIDKYFPIYKEASIDEFYIALDNTDQPIKRLMDLKDEIKEKLSLSCTVGVAKNPIIAKIACEFAKPDGFLIVDDFDKFSNLVSINFVPGIGQKSIKLLNEYNVCTLKDFLNRKEIHYLFDKLRICILKDYTEPEFFKINIPRSIGHYLTLDEKLDNLEEILEIGRYLLFGLYSRLLRYRLGVKTLSAYLKDSFGNFSSSKSLWFYSKDYVLISKILDDLYKGLFSGKPVSKIGLSLNNLKLIENFQESLFWDDITRKFENLASININNLYFAGFLTLKRKKEGGSF
ncbi:MAG: hypothetical protein N2Z58_06820 [Fervidobacterium sp.]|nr:hypothetical protein [Fervidobacterium sp.]